MEIYRNYGWIVAGYYNDTVQPPKKAGDLALEVWCGATVTKDLEVKVFNERKDIGTVTVRKLHAD